jgi:hypothetical protein
LALFILGCLKSVQAGRAKALVLKGAVTNFTLPVEENRAPQRIAGLAFVQPRMAALAQVGTGQLREFRGTFPPLASLACSFVQIV